MKEDSRSARKPKRAGTNEKWHRENRMPRNPSLDERIQWHLDHSRNCRCRPIPPNLAAQINRRKLGRPAKAGKPPF